MNSQAEELNTILETDGPVALELLSDRGKEIFFPRKGMVAQGLDAKGKSINASIGEAREDDGTPLRLSPLEKRIDMKPADVFSYAPSFGKPELRDYWHSILAEKNPGLKGNIYSRPVVTNAITHGLSVAGYLFVNPNDSVILPNHYWGNYRLVLAHPYGARLQTFPMFTSSTDSSLAVFNIKGLRDSLMTPNNDTPANVQNKKILLLNFPNNPTGYTPTEQELDSITDCIDKAARAGNKVLVILDDAYFGLVYRSGVATESPFARLANLHDNVVACKADGATKEDYVWGFRVGFITFAGKNLGQKALAVLEDKAAGAVRGSISNDSHLAQSLLLAAYQDPDYQTEKLRAKTLLKSRHDALVRELDAHPEYRQQFSPLPFNSGYFMCVQINKGDAEAVRQKLLAEYDTGVIAIGNLVRIAFSCLPAPQIPQLFSNLYRACKEL